MDSFEQRDSDAVSSTETAPDTAPAAGFRLAIADVFNIPGRGLVIHGTVQAGMVSAGTRVTIEPAGRPSLEAEITAIQTGGKIIEEARAGDSVSLLFRELTGDQVAVGGVVRTT